MAWSTRERGPLRIEEHGAVYILCLNNPKKKNALTNEAYAALTQELNDAAVNPKVTAVVVTGAGDYFCSGTDVAASLAPEMANPATAPVGRFMMAVLRFPKILAAAVNGPAIGIGVTLLPHCDLVFCATSATFWVPFLRIAVVPEFGSSVTFPRILGQAVAGDMLLGQRVISAAEALQWGLVSQVFPGEKLVSEVLAKLQSNLKVPLAHDSLLLYKRMLRRWTQDEIETVVLSELKELGARYVKGEIKGAIEITMARQRQSKAAREGSQAATPKSRL